MNDREPLMSAELVEARPSTSSERMGQRVEVVLIYQSLLGLYGDRGNATVLIKRLAWRGYEPVLTLVEPGDPLPDTGHVYLLGGGEDAAQISAVRALKADGGLQRAADRGAAILAVCAGYQIVGNTFTVGYRDEVISGLGLLDVTHHPWPGTCRWRDHQPLERPSGSRSMDHRLRKSWWIHPARTRRNAACSGGNRGRQLQRRHRRCGCRNRNRHLSTRPDPGQESRACRPYPRACAGP